MCAPGTVSWIRFSARSKVDLPEPEGPISAVIWLRGTCMFASRRARNLPYHALRSLTLITKSPDGCLKAVEGLVWRVMAAIIIPCRLAEAAGNEAFRLGVCRLQEHTHGRAGLFDNTLQEEG